MTRREKAIRFDPDAAADALARLDHGEGRDGDEELAAALDGFCRQADDEFRDEMDRAEEAARRSRSCGGCVPGGGGEACDEHRDDPPTTSSVLTR